MKQILKAGDLVKYHKQDGSLDFHGFTFGHMYLVFKGEVMGAKGLCVKSQKGEVIRLIDDKGELTINTDHFAKHKCPVVLPRGIGQ